MFGLEELFLDFLDDLGFQVEFSFEEDFEFVSDQIVNGKVFSRAKLAEIRNFQLPYLKQSLLNIKNVAEENLNQLDLSRLKTLARESFFIFRNISSSKTEIDSALRRLEEFIALYIKKYNKNKHTNEKNKTINQQVEIDVNMAIITFFAHKMLVKSIFMDEFGQYIKPQPSPKIIRNPIKNKPKT